MILAEDVWMQKKFLIIKNTVAVKIKNKGGRYYEILYKLRNAESR